MDRGPPSDINGDLSRNERGLIDNISRALRRADKATRTVDRYTNQETREIRIPEDTKTGYRVTTSEDPETRISRNVNTPSTGLSPTVNTPLGSLVSACDASTRPHR